MATKLLLLEDVDSLGRSGEVVSVRPGYARNFLIPKKLAVTANKQALRLQERLKEERQKRAFIDLQESEEIAARLNEKVLIKVVKVDHEGRMYGSVTLVDIAHLLAENFQIEVEKKAIQLKHAIKTTGVHSIGIKLKEGITASVNLTIMSEEAYRLVLAEEASVTEK